MWAVIIMGSDPTNSTLTIVLAKLFRPVSVMGIVKLTSLEPVKHDWRLREHLLPLTHNWLLKGYDGRMMIRVETSQMSLPSRIRRMGKVRISQVSFNWGGGDIYRFPTLHTAKTNFLLENLWISEASLHVLEKFQHSSDPPDGKCNT